MAKKHSDDLLLWSEISWAMFAGCCLFAGWTLTLWLVPHWLYFPNWVPIPGYRLMAFVTCFGFGPLILLVVALPTLVIFILVVLLDSTLLLRQIVSQSKQGIKLGMGLVIVSLPVLPWIFGKRIDDTLIRYAISRYNVDIDAIEQYYEDHGEYPATLDTLVSANSPTVDR